MLRMVSYPHRPKSGHITCYLNRTYHVLTTEGCPKLGGTDKQCYHAAIGDRAMRLSRAQWRRPLATCPAIVPIVVVLLGFSVSPAPALQQSRPDTPGAPVADVSNIPKPIIDTLDRVNVRDSPNA